MSDIIDSMARYIDNIPDGAVHTCSDLCIKAPCLIVRGKLEIERLRQSVLFEQDRIAAFLDERERLRAEIERLRGALIDVRLGLQAAGHHPLSSPEIRIIDAALGTADQPDGGEKCKCDDHEAKYCVNRISRTDPCQCGCHRGANATATP